MWSEFSQRLKSVENLLEGIDTAARTAAHVPPSFATSKDAEGETHVNSQAASSLQASYASVLADPGGTSDSEFDLQSLHISETEMPPASRVSPGNVGWESVWDDPAPSTTDSLTPEVVESSLNDVDTVTAPALPTSSATAPEPPSSKLLQLQAQLAGALAEISLLKSTLGVLEKEHRDYQTRATQVLASQTSELTPADPDSSVVSALRAQIAALRMERSASRDHRSILETEVSKLRETIMLLQDQALDTQSRLELSMQQLEKQSSEALKLTAQLDHTLTELRASQQREASCRDKCKLISEQHAQQAVQLKSLQAELLTVRSASTGVVPSFSDQTSIELKRLSDRVVVQQVEIDRLLRVNEQLARSNQSSHTSIQIPSRREAKSSQTRPLGPLSWVSILFPRPPLLRLSLLLYAVCLQLAVFFLMFREVRTTEAST